MGDSSQELSTVKYHHFHRFFTYSVERRLEFKNFFLLDQTQKDWFLVLLSGSIGLFSKGDPLRGQSQVGSLTGAVHLSKGNAGVLRAAQ